MSSEPQIKLLITGATGMVGRNFVRWLRRNVRPFPAVIALGRKPVEGIENILLSDFSADILRNALDKRAFDIVIHLAAAGVHPGERDTELLTRINSELPPLIVQAAAKAVAKTVVIAGSSAEYATPTGAHKLTENMPLEANKIYGVTKAVGGVNALKKGAELDVPVGVARFFNVYGPGEAPHRLLPSLATALGQGKEVPLSPGAQIRDFIYVDDICDALWQMALGLMHKKIASGAYNICTGMGHSVADFARMVAQAGDYDANLLKFGAIPMRPDDIPYLVGDACALQAALGWKARYSLADGVAASLKSLREGEKQ